MIQILGEFEYLIARTPCLDQWFQTVAREGRYSQVVFLGAGHDTRSYRFKEIRHGLRLFELDALTTQMLKRNCLEEHHIEMPRDLHFASIDFNKDVLDAVLDKAGFQRGQKTFFIWEGVSMYLFSKAVDMTLSTI